MKQAWKSTNPVEIQHYSRHFFARNYIQIKNLPFLLAIVKRIKEQYEIYVVKAQRASIRAIALFGQLFLET
jgi:5'(3')-deoxyribonucleotidase